MTGLDPSKPMFATLTVRQYDCRVRLTIPSEFGLNIGDRVLCKVWRQSEGPETAIWLERNILTRDSASGGYINVKNTGFEKGDVVCIQFQKMERAAPEEEEEADE